MREPDQVDMMDDQELRFEFRRLVETVVTYRMALRRIRDMDYRGNRHESAIIASTALGDDRDYCGFRNK